MREGIGQKEKILKQEDGWRQPHTANAVGSLSVLQRHIARRPTPGNAKHVGGARRRSLFGGALVCIVCAGRDAVPLSVRQSRVTSGQVRAISDVPLLLYYYYYYYYFTYLPTFWISVLLRCAVRHPGWLARSLLPEQSPLRWHAQARSDNQQRWSVEAVACDSRYARASLSAPCACERQSGGGSSWSEREQPGPARTLLAKHSPTA